MDEQNTQQITPWEVHSGETEKKIDYTKIIKEFGCEPFSLVLARKYNLDHILFRRGMVFAHRDFISLLEAASRGESIYLYTGRGPSSKSLHLGHSIPFLLCRYLQERFKCKIVIQVTDDEKYIWKDITVEQAVKYGEENVKDIIAFGLDPEKTFIFSNIMYAHNFIRNTLKIEKSISMKKMIKVFGFEENAKVGQISFPCRQMAPCYPSSFPRFLESKSWCLIPCSIDQDPYFRVARDIAEKMSAKKPATLYTCFLPALQGTGSKMSASCESSSIYFSDTAAEIKKKIRKYAFSGGKDTAEEHRKLGGDPSVDVAFQYLRFFLEDDILLAKYENGYKDGSILSGEMKNLCIETVQEFVRQFQERRKMITEDTLKMFYSECK